MCRVLSRALHRLLRLLCGLPRGLGRLSGVGPLSERLGLQPFGNVAQLLSQLPGLPGQIRLSHLLRFPPCVIPAGELLQLLSLLRLTLGELPGLLALRCRRVVAVGRLHRLSGLLRCFGRLRRLFSSGLQLSRLGLPRRGIGLPGKFCRLLSSGGIGTLLLHGFKSHLRSLPGDLLLLLTGRFHRRRRGRLPLFSRLLTCWLLSGLRLFTRRLSSVRLSILAGCGLLGIPLLGIPLLRLSLLWLPLLRLRLRGLQLARLLLRGLRARGLWILAGLCGCRLLTHRGWFGAVGTSFAVRLSELLRL